MTVQVTIFDVIYQNKVCNLLYMQDLSKFVHEPTVKTSKPAFDLSDHQAVTNKIISAHDSVCCLNDRLLAEATSDESRRPLIGIQFGARMAQLMFLNLLAMHDLSMGEEADFKKHLDYLDG